MTKPTRLGSWQLLEQIGKGGNGQVYRACFGAEVAALKLLHKHDRVQRFRDEVSCMKRLVGTQGVLPVIDSYIPDAPTKMDPAWFVMPLATPLLEEIGDLAAPVEVVKAIRAFALVLASLHGKGFSHRDVKPDNLFKFGSDWVVGDFGLVDFDGKDHETALGERIGPMHFIAPEMLLARQPEDGKAADVYSLAKTLWVLLTGFRSPVPGGYDAASPTCQLRSYVTLPHSIELDRLIERCTTIEPLSRPTMEAFGEEVAEWLRMNDRNEQGAQAVGPLAPGNEWAEVVEAASRQELARTAHARLHNDTRATVDAFYASLSPFYNEVIGILRTAHLGDIQGPNGGTSPPGVVAWFPEKSVPEKRVGLELRVWFNPDWEHLERRQVKALALARLRSTPTTGGTDKELYRLEASFMIEGPAQIGFVERMKSEVRSQVGSWLDRGRQHWSALG